MKFVKWFRYPNKNIFEVYHTKKLSEVDINAGDTVLAFNEDGTPYGVCGTVYASQVDLSRQIESKVEYKQLT